ncbi:hypothetical protein R1flu_026559 [Riccia fluitans]|uniref:Reverse transcriptase n=1 Tax=Riccia fluitans TaxID=41844 RepID=A0ABD1XGB5_9MARC
MGLHSGAYPACCQSPETLEYILWTCRKARHRTQTLLTITSTSTPAETLLQWIDEGLQEPHQHPALLALIYKYTFRTWKEWNERQFRFRLVHAPPLALVKEALLEFKSLLGQRMSSEKLDIFLKAKDVASEWLRRMQGPQIPGTSRNPRRTPREADRSHAEVIQARPGPRISRRQEIRVHRDYQRRDGQFALSAALQEHLSVLFSRLLIDESKVHSLCTPFRMLSLGASGPKPRI